MVNSLMANSRWPTQRLPMLLQQETLRLLEKNLRRLIQSLMMLPQQQARNG